MKKLIYIVLACLLMVSKSHAVNFTPLYPVGNLVPNPELTNMNYFSNSWGSAIITTAPNEAYSGTSCGKIQSNEWGSLTFTLTWKPNTTYIMRAMVKTNGTFQIGVGNTYLNNGNNATDFEVPNTNNEWVLFERTFTTGNNAGFGECWFNNYYKGGSVGYIDNWEIYEENGCYQPLYPSGNLVPDPELTSRNYFTTSWGSSVITTASDEVYCGTSCGKIPTEWGSLTFTVNWKPNTTYVLRARVKTNGVFQIGVGNTYISGVEYTDYEIPSTNNQWVLFERTFTTGSNATTGECWFNNAWKSGTVGYIDNWELYEVPTTGFRPLYPTGNMVPDPEMTNKNNFPLSWGSSSITNAAGEVYSGTSSGKIVDSGSLTFATTWKPNTSYTVRAMVKTTGTFQIGMFFGEGSYSMDLVVYDTNGEWVMFERSFTTGDIAGQGDCWFNNWSRDGSLGYIDNWELYEDPSMTASIGRLAFDDLSPEKTFVVNTAQLSGPVTIEAPAGITVTPSTLSPNSSGQIITATFDGTTYVDGEILISNWYKQVTIPVKGVVTDGCYVPALAFDNLVPNPEISEASHFLFTGRNSGIIDLVTDPGIPYCGATCGKIGNGTAVCSGSIEVTNIVWKPNTVYRVIAMVRAEGTLNLGLSNVDGTGTERNFLITGNGSWNKVDYTFKTGPEATTGACYFNNCEGSTSRTGYIDNWEIYEIPNDLCD